MAKYILQPRRGTLAEWQAYEQQESHVKPFEGEICVEYDTVNGKRIPRLKIGDGENEFTDLEYISVDSFILPAPATVTLLGGDHWIQDTDENGDQIPNRYYQVVTVHGDIVTANSKVDLQPSPEQLSEFHQNDITFTAVNDDGIITVYVIGVKPENNYTMQVTITEVVDNG